MINRRAAVGLLATSVLVSACGTTTAAAGRGDAPAVPARMPAPRTPARAVWRPIPGLGPVTTAAIPGQARQAVVVTGRGRDSPVSTAVLHERTEAGWQSGQIWPAHNALHGWSGHHTAGDLRSPLGVYTLSDAGGLLADPGSRLPYDRSSGFVSPGTGFEGEPLAGSFDYVVAIDYNRRPGTSPLDWTRPLGPGRGGGIWIHVDHGGPTHGCVSIGKAHMKALLRALDPDRHPVVVLGYADWLAR
ncbi:L,D-transpeptidase family protein [Streptomyces sp. NPDC059378]|uniref:L,D-transpeptidase family protein n=1 Tax=Streptomyces sp. NPDC059378 TaxID=3346815 RepID=UPI0036861DCB